MRILHTADWHLGRIFFGVHLTEDQAYVLDQFVDLVTETKADAVIIAGDIYDRSVPPVEAVKLLDDTLTRLAFGCKTPVFLIAGNHDSPDRLGFGSRLMTYQNLHVSGSFANICDPIILSDTHGPVYFYPIPYAEPSVIKGEFHIDDSLDHNQGMQTVIRSIRSTFKPDHRNVAIAHAFVRGGIVSDSERPLTVGGTGEVDCACFSGFNYSALGHLHKSQTVYSGSDENSIGKNTNVTYSGSLLKYSFRETEHRKSVSLVTLNKKGRTTIEEIGLSPKRDVRSIKGTLEEIIRGAESDYRREDYLMVTLEDKGALLDAMGKLRDL